MKTLWKKTFLVALPLAGLLIAAPAAEARKYHHHKRDHHCRTYKKQGWHERGRYDYYDRSRYDDYYNRGRYGDYYGGRRAWYGARRPYYDSDQSYPSRYPYGAYYGEPYNNQPYYGEFPWWELLFSR